MTCFNRINKQRIGRGIHTGNCLLDSLLALKDLSILALERLFVEVFTAKAGLSANLYFVKKGYDGKFRKVCSGG